ncbi:uncharacterized protein LOC134016029 [Osmerus eperlanus]|uniref:uncharacterized protein LOC134016029 n=1 Tax=Osmerus eperlanus TaxID=29151 RepID=UPI002E1308C5
MVRFFNLFRHINFTDVIRTSFQIHPGPPARYQLKPEKESLDGMSEEESRLRRWTFGERDHSKVNKTILLVGQTGTGKSTMINNMTNYVMGVEMEDKVWFEMIEEKTGKSQSKSQTSTVTMYQIFGFEGRRVPYSLTIIDTPGFADTEGVQEDEIIVDKLHDLFRCENRIHEIDAVGFLLKSSTNRLDDQQKYVFNEVASLFGKDMENNIVFLMTHSDGMPPTDALQAIEDADIKCAKDKNGKPVHFLFNNHQNKFIECATKKKYEEAWEVSADGNEQFFNFLNKTEPQKLRMTIEVMTEHIRLRACIQNMKERIELSEKKQKSIEKIKIDLELHKKDIETNKNFTIPVEEVYKVRETINAWWDNKAVTCSRCEENCHHPGCTLAVSPWWCEVMRGSSCTSCTGRCSYTHHVKQNFKYVTKTRVVWKTVEEMKKKYETKTKLAGQEQSLLSGLEAEMKELQDEQNRLVMEAFECVVSLEAIALNVHSSTIHDHLDFIIKKLKANKQQQKAQKLEEIKNRRQGI